MRVIAGCARRLNLKTPPGTDTRPTADRIKETLFNIISNEVAGCLFLDLFSGSGGIGIEALSRGALRCVFVDKNPKSIGCIKENLEFTGLSDRALVLQRDVLLGIRDLSSGKERFDIIYIDPPYHLGIEKKTLEALCSSNLIDESSLIIVEADKNNKFDWLSQTEFKLVREKVYKTNKHLFLKKKDGESD